MNSRFSTIREGALGALRCAAVALPAALIASTLLATPALAAEGDPSITYNGASNELTVEGGYDASAADLFASFKGLVPGDSVTQTVDLSFTDISAGTRLFIQADTSRLSDAAKDVLAQMELSVSFAGEGTFAPVDTAAVHEVFAGEDAVLVATVNEPAEATMALTLTIPTSVGNELAELQEVTIPWIITVQEDDGEDGGPASTALNPHAIDLIAYEGGMGTDATTTSVGNALPDPEWTNVDWDGAQVSVDNEVWDVETQGLPFRWAYGTVADDPALVETSARAGYYYLLVAPLEGNPVVTVNGKLLTLPVDYVVTQENGSDVMMQVRDVTDDTAADTLATSHFKTVYGEEASSLARTLSGLLVTPAYATDTTLSGVLDGPVTSMGTHAGDCDNTVAHAHVAAGTTFVKNGNTDLPVNDDARIGLLWDDFIAGVLGEPEREGVLDAKAREAAGGIFASGEGVQRRFKYLDLVDMNDGNLWVATADQSAVTIFVPYFEGISAEDDIAVVRFDNLTRDYTLDLSQADLDARIAASEAHAVKVTKAEDGILFEVPWAEFGPFELLWRDADWGETDDKPVEEPGDETDDTTETDDETDKPHTDLLPHTGDTVLALVGGVLGAALLLIVVGLVLSRRRRNA